MPSYNANELIRLGEDLIGRPLNVEEKLQAEEIVLNVYPGAAKRWMRTWHKAQTKRGKLKIGFDYFYNPIMCGIIVGGMKCKRELMFKFDTPAKREIYAAMHTYLGTDFTMKELEDIVWFTKFSTLSELRTAIDVAQHHGVVNCAYVRAIIVGNRRKAAAVLRSHDARFKTLTEDPPNVITGVPNVRSIQDAWTRRLKAAIERSDEDAVERGASKKLRI